MLRAGFVGFGRMGITHFSILGGLDRVTTVAVCEPSKAMRSVLGKYLDVKLYDSYTSMLDSEDLDFIVISTPPDSHAEIILHAIKRGVSFFVEKPLTLDKNSGTKILDVLEHSDVVSQVGYVNRFCETFVELKRLLGLDVLGDIKTFSSEMYSATVLKDSSSGWRSQKKAGGGCMFEMASHCVDLAVYLFGRPSGVSGSVVQGIYSSSVDDLVSSTLHYDNEVSGRVVVNWSDASYRKPGNIVTVQGTKGKIVASKYHLRLFLLEDRPDLGFQAGWNTRYLTDLSGPVDFYVRGNEFTQQLMDFVGCVETGEVSAASCHDAYITDRILEAIATDANIASVTPLDCNGGEPESVDAGWFQRLYSRLLELLRPAGGA